MEASRVVVEMEQLLLPRFREAAAGLASEYPQYKFQLWSASTGGATEYQGHDLGVECSFPDAEDHEADCVAAYVGVKHLTTEPLLCEACVEWGKGDHPDVRCELLESPLPATEAALQRIQGMIPGLIAVFRQALHAWSARGADA
jgi:hypothetical protein